MQILCSKNYLELTVCSNCTASGQPIRLRIRVFGHGSGSFAGVASSGGCAEHSVSDPFSVFMEAFFPVNSGYRASKSS